MTDTLWDVNYYCKKKKKRSYRESDFSWPVCGFKKLLFEKKKIRILVKKFKSRRKSIHENHRFVEAGN